MKERQELYCHNCNKYVQFDLDMELDGQHVLNCPNCGHEHYRIVRNGKITEKRWASMQTYYITNCTSSSTSTTSTYYYNFGTDTGTASIILASSWTNGLYI